jgi:predicted nucleic acid-binding protein
MRELQRHAPEICATTLPAWLRQAQPSAKSDARAARWVAGGLLDDGEAESLACAEEMKPDLFVIDDAAARLMAESLSVPARGSLGIILLCAVHGHLSKQDAETHLRALTERTTLWLSAKVRSAATEALAEIFR